VQCCQFLSSCLPGSCILTSLLHGVYCHETFIATHLVNNFAALKACDDGILIQLLCFLDIIHRPCFIENNVSEAEFCLRVQVKTYSVGPNR
jgi:hypothetical protein